MTNVQQKLYLRIVLRAFNVVCLKVPTTAFGFRQKFESGEHSLCGPMSALKAIRTSGDVGLLRRVEIVATSCGYHWSAIIPHICHRHYRRCLCKTRPKSARWCAILNHSLYWLIRFIWFGLLDFWVDWIGLVYLIDWLNGRIQYIICPKSYISYLISVGLIEYLTVESFMRYLIEVGMIKYLTVESFMRYLIEVGLVRYLMVESLWDIWFKLVWWNISRLKFSWDIWFKLVWLDIAWLKVLWDILFKLVWWNISRLKVSWDILFQLVRLNIS